MQTNDPIYQLTDARKPISRALPYFLAAAALLAGGLFSSGVFSWGFMGLAVVALAIGIANYLSGGGQTIMLSEYSIALQNKAGKREILFAEIERAELSTHTGGQMQKSDLFSDTNTWNTNKSSMLHIVDSSGKRLEIRAGDFDESDFRSFLDVLTSYAGGQRLATQSKIKALRADNELYLKQDQQLAKELQKTLLDAYKAIYETRGDFYMRNNTEAEVLLKYQANPNDAAIFFLDKDYKEGLDQEALEAGRQLIATVKTNLEVVESRITNYRQIAERLSKMQEAEEAQAKIGKIAGRLQSLQSQNRNAAKNTLLQEHQFQIDTLEQLQLMTHEVQSLDDLSKVTLLKEQSKLM